MTMLPKILDRLKSSRHPRRRHSRRAARVSEGLETRTLLAATFFDSYDFNEGAQNQSFNSPSQLGAVANGTTINDLTLFLSSDVDYYRFDIVASAYGSHGVSLNRSNHFEDRTTGFVFGNAELALWEIESAGFRAIDTATTGLLGASASVSLADQPPGSYLIRVLDTSGFNVTGNYSLQFNVPTAVGPDVHESQESQSSPYNIGIVTGASTTYFGSIHAAGDDDYFKFTILDTGGAGDEVRLTFDGTRGNIGLILQNSSGTELARSNGGTGTERISLSGRSAGIYRIRVFSNGHTNPSYNLSVQAPEEPAPEPDTYEPNNFRTTAHDLGALVAEGLEAFDGRTLHSNDDVDWYRFRIPGRGAADAEFRIGTLLTEPDLLVALYDARGNRLADGFKRSNSVAKAQILSMADRAAGEYYLRVSGPEVNEYAMGWLLPPAITPDQFDTASRNDTPATTTILSIGTGPADNIFNLSLHDADDEDFLRVTTTAVGTSADSIIIDPDHDEPNVYFFVVNDATGELVGSSFFSDDDRNVISLAGAPAGDYTIVIGSGGDSVFDYELTLNLPQSVREDRFEQTPEASHDLGVPDSLVEHLSIHAGDEFDFFDFELAAVGDAAHAILIQHDTSVTQLDAALFDSSGNVVRAASESGAADELSLADLVAGRYTVGVFSPDGVPHPNYALRFNTPNQATVGDRLENNNTWQTATVISPHGVTVIDDRHDPLSIHDASDEDWYRLDFAEAPQQGHFVSIGFDSQQGDLDLSLHRVLSDGTASPTPFVRSETSGNLESLKLDNLGAGTWYIRVQGHNNAVNPRYGLVISGPGPDADEIGNANNNRTQSISLNPQSFNSATGQLAESPLRGLVTRDQLSIHPAFTESSDNARGLDEDWYSFDLAAVATDDHFISIDFPHELGNLELELQNAAGDQIDLSATVNDQEVISLDGLGPADGRLYVRIRGTNGGHNPYYSLTVNAPNPRVADRYDAQTSGNNTEATATELNVSNGLLVIADSTNPLSIHNGGDVDWYTFELDRAGRDGDQAAIAFSHAQGDLNLTLFDAAGTRIQQSASATSLESVSLRLQPPGRYFLKVEGHDRSVTNAAYTLLVQAPSAARGDIFEVNDTPGAAGGLGEVSGTRVFTDLSLHTTSDVDEFSFTTTATGLSGHEVAIAFQHTDGDVDLTLTGPGGLRRDSATEGDFERISLEGLPADDYRIRVSSAAGVSNPNYSLVIAAPDADGDFAEIVAGAADNNQVERAFPLRTIRGEQTFDDLSIHATDDVDWYKLQLAEDTTADSTHFVAIAFDHSIGDLDLGLFDASGNPLTFDGSPRSSETAANIERVSLQGLSATDGEIFVRVVGHNNATNPNYSLLVSAPDDADVQPDRFEANDVAAEATPLGVIARVDQRSGLSLHEVADVDWFEFSLESGTTAVDGHQVAIGFDGDAANLRLDLYAASDTATPLSSSANDAGDSEVIFLAGLSAADGPFMVKVSGAVIPSYTLRIDAPVALESDWAEDHPGGTNNNSTAAAYDLGLVSGIVSLPQLSIDSASDVDVFRFESTAFNGAEHFVRLDFNNSDGDLKLELLNASGAVDGTSARNAGFEQLSLRDLSAGVWYVRVSGNSVGETQPSYQLTITAAGELLPDVAEGNDFPGAAFDLGDAASFSGVSASRSGLNSPSGIAPSPFNIFTPNHSQLQAAQAPRNYYGLLSDRQKLANLGIDYDRLLQGLFPNLTAPQPQASGFGSLGISFGFNRPEFSGFASTSSMSGFSQVSPFALQNSSLTQAFPTPLPPEEIPFLQAAMPSLTSIQNSPLTGIPVVSSPHDSGDVGNTLIAPPDSLRVPIPTDFGSSSSASGTSSPGASNTINATDFSIRVVSPLEKLLTGGNPAFSSLDGLGTRSQVTASGGLEQQTVLSGLSLHNDDDVDWYRFELTTDAVDGQFATLFFDEERPDLQFTLHETTVVSATNPNSESGIDAGVGSGTSRQIDLDGLIAGTYLLRVTGDMLHSYDIVIDVAATAQPTADGFEDNNSAATAYDLRNVEGILQLDGLSIHAAGDEDWFRFTTAATGIGESRVRIDFDHAAGDLELELRRSDGTTIVGSSSGTANQETVSLQGEPAGDYFIRVSEFTGAVGGIYRLTLNMPEAVIPRDRFEAQNAVTPDLNRFGTIDGRTIHPGDSDQFSFELSEQGTAADRLVIDLLHGQGDLIVTLTDPTGFVTTDGLFQPGQMIFPLEGRDAGLYSVFISGPNNATNRYRVTLDAATDTTDATPATDDWTIMVYMTAGNLERFAERDLNELETAVAGLSSSVNVVVMLDQSSGDVSDIGGTTRPAYQFATGGAAAWGGTGFGIVQADRDTTRISTRFDTTDATTGGDAATGERNSGDAATLVDFVNWAVDVAPADNYALVMWDHGSGVFGTNFDEESLVDGEADVLTTAELSTALGQLDQQANRVHFGVLSFDACLMAMAEVAFSAADFADVVVASQENEGREGYDYTTAFQTFTSGREASPQTFAAGIVSSYARQYSGLGTDMDTQSAIDTAAIDDLQAALRVFTDYALTSTDSTLWTGLRVAASGVTVYGSRGGLYRDINQFLQNVVDDVAGDIADLAQNVIDAVNAAVIDKTRDARNSSGLSLMLPLSHQTLHWNNVKPQYAADHAAFHAATGWYEFLEQFVDGSVAAGSRLQADWAGRNSIAARAFNLQTIAGNDFRFPDLVVESGRDDWFRFRTRGTNHDLTVVLQHDEAISRDVRITVLRRNTTDGTLQVLGEQSGSSGGVTVSLADAAAGDYLLRVTSMSADSAVYRLTLSGGDPEATTNDVGVRSGSRSDKAVDLNVINSDVVIPGLSIPAASDGWFSFSTPRLAVSRSQVSNSGELDTLQIYVPNGQSLQAKLTDDAGGEIAAATGSGVLYLQYDSGLGAEYRLHLTAADSTPTTVPATLHFIRESTLALELTIDRAVISEGQGPTTARVTRIGNLSEPLTVSLISSSVALDVPQSITIPAALRSAEFTLSAVNNSIVDDVRTVSVTASAAGYTDGLSRVDLADGDVALEFALGDLDGSGGFPDQFTDGVLMLGFLGGLRTAAQIQPLLGSEATLADAQTVVDRLTALTVSSSPAFDVDQSGGAVDQFTDGILLLAYFSGLRQSAQLAPLIVAPPATIDAAAITANLDALFVTPASTQSANTAAVFAAPVTAAVLDSVTDFDDQPTVNVETLAAADDWQRRVSRSRTVSTRSTLQEALGLEPSGVLISAVADSDSYFASLLDHDDLVPFA